VAATRTTARAGSDRRAAIIGAALDRFLAQGLSATTLREIQRDARASNGSFFHHFPSKEALAGAVYVDCVTRYQQAFLDELGRHADAEAAVRGIIDMHLGWCADHPGMARFLITMTDPAVLGAAEGELTRLNERFVTALLAWWRPHAPGAERGAQPGPVAGSRSGVGARVAARRPPGSSGQARCGGPRRRGVALPARAPTRGFGRVASKLPAGPWRALRLPVPRRCAGAHRAWQRP
jgi:AcrR family transcriptional regulator